MVTAGELGSDVREVEVALGKALQIAARWNAVLLLDEADVFLQERSAHEVERNKLVSSMLIAFFISPLLMKLTSGFLSSIPSNARVLHRHPLRYHEPTRDYRQSVQIAR